MSIIIQTGHETSKSKQLMEKLYERGLSRPNDSYTHKMTPDQVSENLYKVLVRESMSSANERMTDNIMIDLLLANLDFENWGWESNKNLTSLEYWGQIEPDVRFILVFDHPHNILKELSDMDLTSDMIDHSMKEWVNYHQKVLNFLKNNDKKAILVEGEGAISNTNDLSKQVKNLATNLHFKSSWQLLNTNNQKPLVSCKSNSESNVLAEVLAIEILRKYPEVIKTFNLMLEKACIKYSDSIYKTKSLDLDKLLQAINYTKNFKLDKSTVIEKEKYYLKEKHFLESEVSNKEKLKEFFENENAKLKKINNTLKEGKQELETEILKSRHIADQYKSELYHLKEKYSNKANASILKLEEENKLVVKQLHRTQEELENIYNKFEEPKYSIEDNVNTPPEKINIFNIKNISAADKIKKDLPYRLGSKIVSTKKPRDLAVLPLALANEYRKFKKDGSNNIVNLSIIEDSRDFEEVEKVKKHLSYQIGVILVEGFKSPKKIINIPIKISKEIIRFKR